MGAQQRYGSTTPIGSYQKVKLPFHYPTTPAQHEENIRQLERIEWGNAQGTRWATIVVATFDSTDASKATADYVCTNANAGTVINQAISTLIAAQTGASTPFGRIVLLEGTYNVGTTAIGTSSLGGRTIHIQGMGGIGRSDSIAGTRVVATTGAAIAVAGSGSGGGSSLMLSDLQLVNASSSTATVSLVDCPTTMTRCSVMNTSTGGCFAQNDTTGSSAMTQIYNNFFWCTGSGATFGVRLSGGAAVDLPCMFQDNYVKVTGDTIAVWCLNQISTVPQYIVSDNVITGSTAASGIGIRIHGNSSEQCVVANNHIKTIGTGIHAAGYRHIITGNNVEDVGIGYEAGASDPQYQYIVGNHFTGIRSKGIRIASNALTFTVAFNKISNQNGATIGIEIVSGCSNTGVFCNDTYGGYTTTEISDSGTNTRRESWFSGIHGIIAGGTTGQILAKNSGTDYDIEWSDSYVPAGGDTGDVLTKQSNSDYDYDWEPSTAGTTLAGLSDVDVSGVTDGQVLEWDSTSSLWIPGTAGSGAGKGVISSDQFLWSTANMTIAGTTSWSSFGGTGSPVPEITVTAAVDDVLLVSLNAEGDPGTGAPAYIDAHTVVSGSRVNSVATKTAVSNSSLGVGSWRMNNNGVANMVGGSVLYKVVSGDISSGTVKLRLVGRTNTAAGTLSLFGASTLNVEFSVLNFGNISL